MTRALVTCVIILLMLSACTQRVICPAYQSAFIFDKPTQKEKFVYYNESTNSTREVMASNSKTIILPARDSAWAKSEVLPGPALPKVHRVKMDKYLLLPEKTYKKAMRALQTVEMKQVLPKKPNDSTDIAAALDSAARSISDTLTATDVKPKTEETDSVYAITKTKEKYNLDQDAYLWYFRDVLVLPDVRAAMQQNQAAMAAEKKAKNGFFKSLFGKKDKTEKKTKKKSKVKSNATDSLAVDNTKADSTVSKPKRSLNPFKKKSNVAGKETKKKPDDAKKEEDDGF